MNLLRRPRACEWVLIVYFTLTSIHAALALPGKSAWAWLAGLAALAAALSFAASYAEMRTGRRAWSIARDWFPLPFLLAGYWSVDWFADPTAAHGFQEAWIGIDRVLLRQAGLKTVIESLGALLPGLLELCYSLLYTLPPAAMAALYLGGRRLRAPRFLFVLLLAAFTTDLLMPFFPSADPRLRFPGEDLPSYLTPFRMANLWLLDHLDIRTSVLPSGHVTVGLATAFGLWIAWPEKKAVGAAFLSMACAVTLAAVYGRYHYAADALAGAAVASLATAAGELLRRNGRAGTP